MVSNLLAGLSCCLSSPLSSTVPAGPIFIGARTCSEKERQQTDTLMDNRQG